MIRISVADAGWLCAGLMCLGACVPVTAAPSQRATAAQTAAPEAGSTAPTPPERRKAAVPTAVPVASGRLEITSYRSPLLDEQLPLLVYLPPGFEQAAERLPVVYLLHGRGYDEWQWVDLGVTRLATQAIRGGQWAAFAIVMPFQPEPLFSSSDGGPRSYEAEFLEGLLPAVEDRFRLSNRAAERALGGISRGGVWALEIAFRHPQEFASVAALSPALNLNFARPRYEPLWIAGQQGELPENIFLATGDREPAIRSSVEQLSQALELQGVPHTVSLKPGIHGQELWTVLLQQAMDFLVAGWPDGS